MNNSSFKCDSCGRSLASDGAVCPYCEKNLEDYQLHIVVPSLSDDREIDLEAIPLSRRNKICPWCSVNFASESVLTTHSGKNSKWYIPSRLIELCPYCKNPIFSTYKKYAKISYFVFLPLAIFGKRFFANFDYIMISLFLLVVMFLSHKGSKDSCEFKKGKML